MSKKDKGARPVPLGTLAAALVKAGVADRKEAVKAQQDTSRGDRDLGDEGRQRREAERREAYEARRREEADSSRVRSREERSESDVARVRELIRAHLEPGRGNRRWFYVARDGRVPFLDVSDPVMKLLAAGQAGIVESLGVLPEEHAVVSDVQALASLKAYDPEVVRFWNGPPR